MTAAHMQQSAEIIKRDYFNTAVSPHFPLILGDQEIPTCPYSKTIAGASR